MVRVTSKVLASNCRVETLTLRVSCGWVCSIRLCGARGFSKLRSLMYWPCMISGAFGACCGAAPCGACGFCGGGGALVMGYFLCCGRAVPRRAALHKPRAGAAGCHLQTHPPNKRID